MAIAEDNSSDLLRIVGQVRQPSTLAVLESWRTASPLPNEEAGSNALVLEARDREYQAIDLE